MTRRPRGAFATVLGTALLGVAGGLVLSRQWHRGHREQLFSARPWRRHAALGWLERHGDAAALPLLRDYVAWEPVAVLRARGRRVLRALELAA